MDWILEGRCFVNGTLTDCCLGIDEETGRIEAVKKVLTGAPVRRAKGRIVLPAAVDLHVHFRDPGHPKKEDFRTGTLSALLGGVGTVVDMPNTRPTVDTIRNLEEKADAVASKSLVDYGLWATITHRTDDAEALARTADGLKLYLAPTTGVPAGADDQTIGAALAGARRARRLVAVHAEAEIAPEAATLAQYEAARSVAREVEAVQRMATLATARDEVHICHATALPVVEAAHGAGFSAGVTPHHLLLNVGRRWALVGKVNPPLRPLDVRNALWEAFAASTPLLVETDHAPHRWEEKDQPFAETPAGLPGVQTALPILLRHAKAGDVALADVVAAYGDRPAARFGIPKGRLQAGYDADLVLVDPSHVRKIRRDWIASKAGWSPYEGFEALVPDQVFLRGDLVVEDGRNVAARGRGRRLRPQAPGPSSAGPAR